MKFCYIDESGNGPETVLVMAGIVVDAKRMHVTKKDWKTFLANLQQIVRRPVDEFHTRDFYRGRGTWCELSGETRAEIMAFIIEWMTDRKHTVFFSAVDKKKAERSTSALLDEMRHQTGRIQYWLLAALHLALGIQRVHQGENSNKGHTVFIFDREPSEEADLVDMFREPPEWTDSFYGFVSKPKAKASEVRLDQVVDVPYFADSRHVLLLHIADLIAYLLRHHAELQLQRSTEKYFEEKAKVASWVDGISTMLAPDSSRWPLRGACACTELFRSLAPEPLLELARPRRVRKAAGFTEMKPHSPIDAK